MLEDEEKFHGFFRMNIEQFSELTPVVKRRISVLSVVCLNSGALQRFGVVRKIIYTYLYRTVSVSKTGEIKIRSALFWDIT